MVTFSLHWSSLDECEAAGMRIGTSKPETTVLNRKRMECSLQVRDEVLFTSKQRVEGEIDR